MKFMHFDILLKYMNQGDVSQLEFVVDFLVQSLNLDIFISCFKYFVGCLKAEVNFFFTDILNDCTIYRGMLSEMFMYQSPPKHSQYPKS